MPSPRWYVAQTKPHQSPVACEHLRRQGFEVFSPEYVILDREGDKRSPLFPGYVFVQFDVQAPDQAWRKIHSTQGVLRLLGLTGEQPSPVRANIMDELLASGGLVEDVRFRAIFNIGESVEFSEGPLKGQVGRVTQVSRNRVALLFSLLGTETVVYSSPGLLRSAARTPGLAVVR